MRTAPAVGRRRIHLFGGSGSGTTTLGRRLATERWMGRLTCPVVRVDSSRSVEALCDEVLAGLDA